MMTLALLQVGATPDWVGPTIAISLAVIALSFLATAAVARLHRAAARRTKRGRSARMVDGLQDDVRAGARGACAASPSRART